MNSEAHPTHERRSRIGVALLCVALSALAVVPFYWMGQPQQGGSRWDFRMPVTHDMFEHWEQMHSFYQGLTAGEIYPRWEEDTNYGFGAPTTVFYPPGIYYLTSALYVLLRDWLRALLAAHLLIMCASAAAMYWLARRSMSRTAATVAMAAYIALPYHLADQYHREAIAELLGFVWMPLMLGFADELLSQPIVNRQEWAIFTAHQKTNRANVETRTRENREEARSLHESDSQKDNYRATMGNVARPALLATGLGTSYGAFLWSHPPTAYQFSLAFAVAVPVLALLRRNWRGLLWIGGGIVLGLAISAAYLYPAAVEARFIQSEVLAQTWPYSYLLQPDENSRYPQFLALLNHSWWLGSLATLAIVLAFVAFRPKDPREHASANPAERASGPPLGTRLHTSVAAWAILSGFASLMMLRQSDFLGRHIPKLNIGVFPWRMLSISTLAVALLLGAAAQAALDSRRLGAASRSIVFATLVLAIFGGGLWLSVFEAVAPVNAFPAFQPPEAHANYLIIPRAAPCPDDLPGMERVETHGAGTVASVVDWQPQHRVIKVSTLRADPLVVRTFNFPGWRASVDGRAVPLGTLVSTGAIVVGVPPGEHVVTLDFVETPVQRVGTAVTLISAVLMLALAAFGVSARRRRSEV